MLKKPGVRGDMFGSGLQSSSLWRGLKPLAEQIKAANDTEIETAEKKMRKCLRWREHRCSIPHFLNSTEKAYEARGYSTEAL